MDDWFAELTMYAAWAAISFGAVALLFELRNRYRKSQRDRLVASIRSQMTDNIAAAPEHVVSDINALAETRFAPNPELERKLRQDLQSLAILSILDDRVIPKTLLSLSEYLRDPEDIRRCLNFVSGWASSKNPSPMEKFAEAQRGQYEYSKKKRKIARELERA